MLKSLKTRLENTKSEIEAAQFKMSSQMMGGMARMEELRKEIADLARQLKKLKGVSKVDKNTLKIMEKELSDEASMGDDYQDYKERKAKAEAGEFNFGEDAKAKFTNYPKILFARYQK